MQEARTLKSKLDAAREELDAKEHSITELRESLRETDLKTKTVKAQYERARVENNELSKKLLDLKEEGERLRDLKLNAERRREEAESLIECKTKEIDEDEMKRKQMESEIEILKKERRFRPEDERNSVSYTHLTLPTKRIV